MNTRSSIGRKAAGGAAYMGVSQALRIILTLASTIVVARLLTPDDYGVMAMVAPVTAFLLMFQNLGLSHAAIQATTLSDQQSNALFWLNMAASAAITLILLALSPLVAWFYGDPRPGYITAASASTVLLAGSAIQHMALLNRELRFGTVAAIEISSATTSFIATVVAAVLLRSYWALWIGAFIGAAVGRSLVWRASRWRPSLRISFAGSGRLIRFGSAVTGFNLLNFLHRNLDNILIGKVWGPAALGLYDRSYKLMMFPLQNINSPLGRIMFPVLSRFADDPERYRRSYLLALRVILLATIPAISVAAATSERLIPFLLGARWSGAAPIFFWLSLAALLQPVSNSTGWLFMSSGRAAPMMRWAMFQMAIMIPAFVVAVQWGPEAVAAAYFFSTAFIMPFLFIYCVRGTPVRSRDLYAVSAPPFLAGALTWSAIFWLIPDWPMISLLSLALPLSYTVGLAALWIAPGGRDTVRTIWSMVASVVSERTQRRAIHAPSSEARPVDQDE